MSAQQPIWTGSYRPAASLFPGVPAEDVALVASLVQSIRNGSADYACSGGYVAMGCYEDDELQTIMVCELLSEIEVA